MVDRQEVGSCDMNLSLRLQGTRAALPPDWLHRLDRPARTENLCDGKIWSNSAKNGQLACPVAGQQSRPLGNQRRWTGWGSVAFRTASAPICVRPRPSAVSILGARFFSGSRERRFLRSLCGLRFNSPAAVSRGFLLSDQRRSDCRTDFGPILPGAPDPLVGPSLSANFPPKAPRQRRTPRRFAQFGAQMPRLGRWNSVRRLGRERSTRSQAKSKMRTF